ncbi:hypothetical protein B6U80_00680 [Candidatus Pacearchaeota archaeon ex4484_26]|nr:MAG: hypothetical protein B6U80_00680 [Candidatus Pacearchaeota archaeon ex4484_26]
MRILKEEILIFIIYAIVFLYAILVQFTSLPLPLTTFAVPVALTLFAIFILHMLNILFRGVSKS